MDRITTTPLLDRIARVQRDRDRAALDGREARAIARTERDREADRRAALDALWTGSRRLPVGW